MGFGFKPKKKAIDFVARNLSFRWAIYCAKRVLEQQGFGSGADVGTSNELAVFSFVDRPEPLLIDVGANLGEYTAAFLERFPNGKVVAIEPSSVNLERLHERFGRDPRVTIHACAIGREATTAELFADVPGSGLGSLTKRRLDHYGRTMEAQETVSVRTLDEILGPDQTVDLLKIDIEGHELDAIAGAAQLLASDRVRAIQFEFGGANLDTRTTLQDFYYALPQYEIHVVGRRGIFPLGPYEEFYEHYRTTNFVAVRQAA